MHSYSHFRRARTSTVFPLTVNVAARPLGGLARKSKRVLMIVLPCGLREEAAERFPSRRAISREALMNAAGWADSPSPTQVCNRLLVPDLAAWRVSPRSPAHLPRSSRQRAPVSTEIAS